MRYTNAGFFAKVYKPKHSKMTSNFISIDFISQKPQNKIQYNLYFIL